MKSQSSQILLYPVKNPEVIQAFGVDNTNDPNRKDFYKIFNNRHCGVDFKADVGTPICAASDGIVVRKEYHHPGMGKVIGIRNGSIVMLYAHLSKIRVTLGQMVTQGELIALSGNTGKATTGPHLHFEMRDITQPTLKEMVFNPEFDKPIIQLHDEFIYQVNNTNTLKTLRTLSRLYFGTTIYALKIRAHNKYLSKTPLQSLLEHQTKIVVPNY